MVSRLREDKIIKVPQGITSSIPELQARGYEIVSYHGIRVPISSLLCYLLIFLVLCMDRYMEIIYNSVNSIEHPVILPKK